MKGRSLSTLQTSIRYFYIKYCSVLENIIEFPEVNIYKFGDALLLIVFFVVFLLLNVVWLGVCHLVLADKETIDYFNNNLYFVHVTDFYKSMNINEERRPFVIKKTKPPTATLNQMFECIIELFSKS